MKNLNLKYACMDRLEKIIQDYKDNHEVHEMLTSLKDLVIYQMNEIRDQRLEIVAMKHNKSWKQYDSSK